MERQGGGIQKRLREMSKRQREGGKKRRGGRNRKQIERGRKKGKYFGWNEWEKEIRDRKGGCSLG